MTSPQPSPPSRAMETVGTVIMILGGVYWYATPDNVIAPPLIVIAIGGGIALLGHGIRRAREKEIERSLTAQARARMAQRTQSESAAAPVASADADVSASALAPVTEAAPESTPDTASGLDLYTAALLVADPGTSGETLLQITQEHRSLWEHVRAHPNVYPSLASWITAQSAADSEH